MIINLSIFIQGCRSKSGQTWTGSCPYVMQCISTIRFLHNSACNDLKMTGAILAECASRGWPLRPRVLRLHLTSPGFRSPAILSQVMPATLNNYYHLVYQSRARDNTAAPTWPCFQATKFLVIALCLYLWWLLHEDAETLSFSDFFHVIEALLRSRVVVVAKLKNCRVPNPRANMLRILVCHRSGNTFIVALLHRSKLSQAQLCQPAQQQISFSF